MQETTQLKAFQQSWAQYKYWVMSRSQQSYNEIRLLAKNNQWNAAKQVRYETILNELMAVEPTTKTLTVAYQHIWGYFKKQATAKEREQYLHWMSQPLTHQTELSHFLKTLADTYQVKYLQQIKWP